MKKLVLVFTFLLLTVGVFPTMADEPFYCVWIDGFEVIDQSHYVMTTFEDTTERLNRLVTGVRSLDLETQETELVVNPSAEYDIIGLSASPDGQKIAYLAIEGLNVLDLESGETNTFLVNQPEPPRYEGIGSYLWLPNSSGLLISTHQNNSETFDSPLVTFYVYYPGQYTLSLSTFSVVNVPLGSFSPDGKTLAYGIQDRSGHMQIMLMDWDDYESREVAEVEGGFVEYLSWSADQKEILMSGFTHEYSGYAWKLNLENGEVDPVSALNQDEYGIHAAFSPVESSVYASFIVTGLEAKIRQWNLAIFRDGRETILTLPDDVRSWEWLGSKIIIVTAPGGIFSIDSQTFEMTQLSQDVCRH